MRRTLVLLSASLLVLTACSNKTPGNGTPTSSTPSQAASTNTDSTAPSADVPKVTNPVDVTPFLQKPCETMTADQITGLLGSGAKIEPDLTSHLGPICDINAASSKAAVHVTLDNPGAFSLQLLYQARNQHPNQFSVFQPLQPIDGHPVVAFDQASSDSRMTLGQCALAIGVTDQRSIGVDVELSEANTGKKDPCEAAHGVAATILGNLKAGK